MNKLKITAGALVVCGAAGGVYWGYHKVYGSEEAITARTLDLKKLTPDPGLRTFLAGFQGVSLPLRFKSENLRPKRRKTIPPPQLKRYLPGHRRLCFLSYFELARFVRLRMADREELQRKYGPDARYTIKNKHGELTLDSSFAPVGLSFPAADQVKVRPPRFLYLPIVGHDFCAVTYIVEVVDERLRKESVLIALATLDRGGKPIASVIIGESSLSRTSSGEENLEIDTITTIDENHRIEYVTRSWRHYGHNTGTSGYEHRVAYRIKPGGQIVLTAAE